MAKNFDKEAQVDETVKMDAVPEEPVKEVKEEAPKSGKTIEQLVAEVVRGAHGTGRERMLSLGDQYEAVQHEVNQLIKKGEVK
jgi:hypothetical protein